MTTKFGASGFKEMQAALARLAAGVPEEKLRAALREGGELIAEEARRLVPIDTGQLHDSIAVVDERDMRIYGKINGGDVSLYVGPVGSAEDGDVFYARFVEFGSLRSEAQPFMRPAIAAKQADAEKLVAARLAADVADLARDA